jgi:hypothetical protein
MPEAHDERPPVEDRTTERAEDRAFAGAMRAKAATEASTPTAHDEPAADDDQR